MTAHSAAHAEHPPHLAHHFETPVQQFESGKLGMWLFLGTELLMFGGLFCAYAIYRANHPDIFLYAHQFLDKKLGGINTVVLICSSLTMAWAVRAAQLGQRALLVLMLLLTLACAGGFMGIKYVEYKAKFEHGLLPGTHYVAQTDHGHGGDHAAPGHEAAAGEAAAPHAAAGDAHATPAEGDAVAHEMAADEAAAHALEVTPTPPVSAADAPKIGRAAAAPGTFRPGPEPTTDGHGPAAVPANPQIFFGIYFAMTGLHGFHVLAGMIVITWLLVLSLRGTFGPDYFTPVDLVGLYWHIVDLIWIFLFPLLYLIH
ncbi:MAG: cytochrome c oxidase subunit 3 [bacterium]